MSQGFSYFMIDRMFRSVSGYLPETVTLPMFTVILIVLALLLIATFAGWLWWRHYQRNRFIYRFGILWDKKYRPFCATCRTLLGNWSSHSGWKFESHQGRTVRQPTTYHAFDCPICTKPVRLVDHDGYEVSLEHAQAELQTPVVEDDR
jgi:endogenous inhibitor of DNA gyrase (YacG/DUF329 family)